jgi:hypothetical protein
MLGIYAADARRGIRKALDVWFVQYNPLYFLSALSILAGVLVTSQGVFEIGWERGELALSAVVQAYELLLIGGAAILFRAARLRRPAVILALIEVFFLFDMTLRTEGLASVAAHGLGAATVWVVLIPLKLMALLWIFRLRIRPGLVVLPTVAALGISEGPQLLSLFDGGQVNVHLFLTWFGSAVGACALWLGPKLESREDLNLWGRTVLRRSGIAVGYIWAGLYFLHLGAWCMQFSLGPTWAHVAPLVLLMLLVLRLRREFWVWTACAGALALALPYPPAVAPTALACGFVAAVWAYRRGQPRVCVCAILALYFAAITVGWLEGPLPRPRLDLTIVFTAAFAALLVLWRLPLSALAGIAIWGPWARELIPESKLELGITLLAAGFIALVLGVTYSWEKRRGSGEVSEGEP